MEVSCHKYSYNIIEYYQINDYNFETAFAKNNVRDYELTTLCNKMRHIFLLSYPA